MNYVPKSSDSLTEGVHEAEILDNRNVITKIGDYFKYYYDPLISKVYGDIKICETIKSPNFCT